MIFFILMPFVIFSSQMDAYTTDLTISLPNSVSWGIVSHDNLIKTRHTQTLSNDICNLFSLMFKNEIVGKQSQFGCLCSRTLDKE